MIEINQIASIAIGAVLGGLLAWFLFTTRMKAVSEKARSELEAFSELFKEKFEEKDRSITDLKAKLNEASTSLNDKQDQYNELTATKATLEQQVVQLEELKIELKDGRESLDHLTQKNTGLEKKTTELETLIEQERKQNHEKIELLNNAGNNLKTEFQNLANRIFEEKSLKFTDQNKINIEAILNPLREQLSGFRKKVEDVYDKESKDRTSLFNEISYLKNLNQKISEEALNLTNALKGDSKARGTWGEVILERVLEESGLQKGREYDIQVSLKDEKGKIYQPDVIVRLPENRTVIIDSKMSLKDYEQYYSAETEEERALSLKKHIGSIRTHIKSLSSKSYEDLEGIRSLDFILMFVPVEAAFLTAVEHDRALFSEAFEKNIMIVCPSTLLVTLRTIHNMWRYEYQNRNSQDIAKKAGALYDKFVGFVESLQDVGKQLDKAKETYTTAHNRLATGKGNLVKRVQELKELGVKAKKNIPDSLVDQADIESIEHKSD